MRRCSSSICTAALASFLLAGCWPVGSTTTDGGTQPVGYATPTLEVTVSGVHFGPAAPDPGSAASLTTTRDPTTGQVTGASFRLAATIGQAGCNLAFDTFGMGAALGPGQYTVASMQGSSTLNGTVYPTTGERISTPEGSGACTGSGCDGAAFVLTAIDAKHATGYFSGTIQGDTGGVASAVCSFWVATSVYQP